MAGSPPILLTPPLLSRNVNREVQQKNLTFDGFDGVHSAVINNQTQEVLPDTMDSLSEQVSGSSELETAIVENTTSCDMTADQQAHRVTSEAKLYHPKPQRLVSSALAESATVLQAGNKDEVIATEYSQEPAAGIFTEELDFDQQHQQDPQLLQDSDPTGRITNDNTGNTEDLYQPASDGPEPGVNSYSPATPPSNASQYSPSIQEVAGDHSLTLMESLHGRNSIDSHSSHNSSFASSIHPVPSSGAQHQPATIYNGNERMIFYPAPIPVKLRLPPLLSNKNQSGHSENRNTKHISRHISIGAGLGVRRRSSQMIQPPTWFINPDDTSAYAPRSPSPALSIDSGRATLEEDENYQMIGDDDSNSDVSDSSDKKKKKKDNKKNKNKKKGRKVSNPYDTFASDVDEDEVDELMKTQVQQNTLSAFSHYDPTALSSERLLSEGGAMISGNPKPMSLIEELEFRKAKKKNQKKNVVKERAMLEGINDDGTTVRNSLHPLDQRLSKSLLELQYQHDVQYEENNHLRLLARQKQQHLTGPETGDGDALETLKDRRARLKKEKQMEQMEQTETLASRRRRLKKERTIVNV